MRNHRPGEQQAEMDHAAIARRRKAVTDMTLGDCQAVLRWIIAFYPVAFDQAVLEHDRITAAQRAVSQKLEGKNANE